MRRMSATRNCLRLLFLCAMGLVLAACPASNFMMHVEQLVDSSGSESRLASARAITAFNFTSPSATGVVTEATHTVAITVPFGTPVTAMVPSISITGSSVSPASGVVMDFTNPVVYTVTGTDSSTQPYTVTVTVAPSNSKDITAFSIVSPTATGTIVGTAINVTVPFGTNALVANFTTTGASVRVGGTTQTSGVTVNDFASPVTYTVTAADSSTKDYTVAVTVLPLTFNYTGSQQSLNVPAGVTRIRVTATGAAGGLGAWQRQVPEGRWLRTST